ncbi:unnamed protein product [Rhizophagus irregularis]|nr:unnamed protein product [Rhizophagus irregularis]
MSAKYFKEHFPPFKCKTHYELFNVEKQYIGKEEILVRTLTNNGEEPQKCNGGLPGGREGHRKQNCNGGTAGRANKAWKNKNVMERPPGGRAGHGKTKM